MRARIKLILLIGLALAVCAVAYSFRPPQAISFYTRARAALHVLRQGSPLCTVAETVRGLENSQRQQKIQDRLLKVLRMVEKDAAGFELWETPIGRLWIPHRDHTLPFILAERERKIYGAGKQGVHPGDVVLDCGAHVGSYAREALADGAKLVVAIEPGPEQIVCLRRNLSAEIAAGRVILFEKGVWDREDSLTLQLDPHNPAADKILSNPSPGGLKVPLTTIDKLVADLRLDRVDFIKMDIEGAEQRALAGAQGTLARFKPRLAVAAYHRLEDQEKIPALVRRAWSGYRMECGPCREDAGAILPEILYFH